MRDKKGRFTKGIIPWNKGLTLEKPAWSKGLKLGKNPEHSKRMKIMMNTPRMKKIFQENQKFQYKNNPNWGMKNKKHSQESKDKMSKNRKGKPAWNKGKRGLQISWNKGLNYKLPHMKTGKTINCVQCNEKIYIMKCQKIKYKKSFCSRKCAWLNRKGKISPIKGKILKPITRKERETVISLWKNGKCVQEIMREKYQRKRIKEIL